MVRAFLYVWVLVQVGIIVQLQHLKHNQVQFDYLPSLDFLKISEILIFIPIILILAHRTRQMRAYYMRHIHEDEEADEAAAKNAKKIKK